MMCVTYLLAICEKVFIVLWVLVVGIWRFEAVSYCSMYGSLYSCSG